MLESLRIKNFKLLRDVELEPAGDAPTVLIGTNASGKSTVIEVLDFLSRCARDGLENALVAHGGMSAIRTIGVKDPIAISSTWRFLDLDQTWILTWDLTVDANETGQATIRSESLRDGDRVLVETSQDGRRRVYDETAPDVSPTAVDGIRTLAFHALVDPKRHPGLGLIKEVLSQVRVLGALSLVPSWARNSGERASARDAMVISTASFVGREGVGLANALYNLQIENPDEWKRLERTFRAEFPFVKRLVFPPDPGGSRISFAVEDDRFPGRRIHASEMSDGMIAFLCLLALIAHPYQLGVLALDEPDAHLHPSAVRRLLAFAGAKHDHRRLIVVTHSNAILDELADPAASIRVVEATATGARIRKLDPEALAAWRKDYSLSDLRRTGLLDPSNSDYGSSE